MSETIQNPDDSSGDLLPRLYDNPVVRQRIIDAYLDETDGAIDVRVHHLTDFAEDPKAEAIWNQAYAFAENEEATGGCEFDELGGISARSLIEVAERVRTLPDFRGRYALMAEPSPSGALWFDALTGFSSPDVEKAVDRFVSDRALEQAGGVFGVGLDLGCGTGRVTKVLARHCIQTVGIDASAELVGVANKRTAAVENMNYSVGDVTRLPVPDNSVDVVTAIGITCSLDAKQEVAFFSEVSRVLKTNGVMVDGFYGYDEGWHSAQDVLIKLSWKNVLADMIVDTVSGKYDVAERLNENGIITLLSKISLRPERHVYDAVELPRATSVISYRKDAR